MRLKVNNSTEPDHNATKIITKYLWFPMILNNEFRWLEMATIEYKYDVVYKGTWEDGDDWDWVAKKFLN